MIDLGTYNNLFTSLANIDHNSWVYFERKSIKLRNNRNQEIVKNVLVPQIYSKPCKLVRFIYWLFQSLLKTHLTTADNLNFAFKTAATILPLSQNGNQLLEHVKNAAEKILTKLNKKHPKIRIEFIKNRKTAVRVEKRWPPQDLDCSILDLDRSDFDLSRKLGAGSLEVAFSMNWEKDDPFLFNPNYLDNLFFSIRQGNLHPDLKNNKVPIGNMNAFINFIFNLVSKEPIRDHYGNLFSVENANRLRQMMLAIMNLLNDKRQEPGFEDMYASVVLQVCLALDHCSNGINTNIEAIFLSLALPKGGNIAYRIKLALQTMRDTIFRQAILARISNDNFFMEHEAASVKYYYRSMCQDFGLPPSVADFDDAFENYAMRGQEIGIENFFFQHYTPAKIVQKIFKIINDPYDPIIPTKVFTDWVEARCKEAGYNSLGDCSDSLLDEEGRYKPEYIVQLLQELEVLV